ncbi:MAG: NAD-binding protein [Xenococcaceae cyanobacterium]
MESSITYSSNLTNRNFFDLQTLPPRLLVVGGGYIGLKLGQGLTRLGSQTQMIVRGNRVLDREESEVSEVIVKALKQD